MTDDDSDPKKALWTRCHVENIVYRLWCYTSCLFLVMCFNTRM